MDFTRLNTKVGADQGAELHLRHPVLGHKLYSGPGTDEDGQIIDDTKTPERVSVFVRGAESRVVQERLKRLRRKRLRNNREPGVEELEETGIEFVCTLVIGFNGLEKNGEPMEPTEENKRLFFEQSDDLVKQVIDFAAERGNFFKSGSAG